MNHDNYDKDILKALQSIARSLKSIDSKMQKIPGGKFDKSYFDNALDEDNELIDKLYENAMEALNEHH